MKVSIDAVEKYLQASQLNSIEFRSQFGMMALYREVGTNQYQLRYKPYHSMRIEDLHSFLIGVAIHPTIIRVNLPEVLLDYVQAWPADDKMLDFIWHLETKLIQKI